MPDGKAFVLTSSNARGGVPSAKRRFPLLNRTGLTSSTTSSARPCSSSVDVTVELPERIRSGPSSDLMRQMSSTMSGRRPSNGPHSRLSGLWVATCFVEGVRHKTARRLRPEAPTRHRRCAGQAADRNSRHTSRELHLCQRECDRVLSSRRRGNRRLRRRPALAVERDVFENFELSHFESP